MCKEEVFDNLTRIAAALSAQFGPSCEVVVHDLSRPDHSIVYIGGNVTGRRIGGPVTGFVLGLLKEDPSPEDVVGYLAHSRDGKTLKSSTVFVKDRKGKPIGVFCVNFDITSLVATSQELAALTAPSTPIEVEKTFSPDVPNLLHNLIQESFKRVLNKGDLNVDGGMSKEQRQAVIADLEEQGALGIRNSIPILADLFKVSRYTVYKDLKVVREGNGDGALRLER